MNSIKLTILGMSIAGIAMIFLGISNITYVVSVPSKVNLDVVAGKVIKFNCDSRTRYEDNFSYFIEDYPLNIEVQVSNLKCSEVEKILSKNSWYIKAWVYKRAGLATAYIIEINEYYRQSSFLGTERKELNIFSFGMILLGIYLVFKSRTTFNSKKGTDSN